LPLKIADPQLLVFHPLCRDLSNNAITAIESGAFAQQTLLQAL
jgi:hypothetical protein